MRLRALLPLFAVTAGGATAAEPPLSTLVYLCEQSRVLSVVQRSHASPGQPIEVTFGTDGKRMQPVVAASGARYLSTDGAWEWWSKGYNGRLSAADGTVLAANCSRFPPLDKLPRSTDK
jgi:membrane-bound inhibitor of C-type lysozyme